MKLKDAKKYLESVQSRLTDAKNAPIENAKADLREAIAAKDRQQFKEPRVLPSSLNVGDVGKLGDENGDIVFTVFQVHDEDNALIRFVDKLYWGEFPTAGLADGDTVKLTGLVEVTGTRIYKTVAGGTNTVRVLYQYP